MERGTYNLILCILKGEANSMINQLLICNTQKENTTIRKIRMVQHEVVKNQADCEKGVGVFE